MLPLWVSIFLSFIALFAMGYTYIRVPALFGSDWGIAKVLAVLFTREGKNLAGFCFVPFLLGCVTLSLILLELRQSDVIGISHFWVFATLFVAVVILSVFSIFFVGSRILSIMIFFCQTLPALSTLALIAAMLDKLESFEFRDLGEKVFFYYFGACLVELSCLWFLRDVHSPHARFRQPLDAFALSAGFCFFVELPNLAFRVLLSLYAGKGWPITGVVFIPLYVLMLEWLVVSIWASWRMVHERFILCSTRPPVLCLAYQHLANQIAR